MTKITRTFIAFVAACLLAIMLMTVRCFAYDYSTITGTKASGAEISGYSGALEVNVVDFGADKKGKKDSSKAIQKALDYAIDNGSTSFWRYIQTLGCILRTERLSSEILTRAV